MTKLFVALLILVATGAAALQTTQSPATRETPPPPAKPREVKLPQPVEQTLDNGLRVIVVPKHDVPLVAARLMVRSGAAADPVERAGLAALTARVLTKGTETRSAEEIARGVEALGATMVAEALWDATAIDVSVMPANLPKTIEYVADVARNATFAKEELERERAQAIDGLQVALRQPRTLANVVASRLIFGELPYGHNLDGTPASLAAIERADVIRFHRFHYRPEKSVLVIAGDIKPETAFAMAKSAFYGWERSSVEVAPAARREQRLRSRVVVIDMPESGQAAVVVGRRGISRTDPAYVQALVANSVLGGGYSSRLNQEIRIRRGLSYGAGSSFAPRIDAGPFTARTETKHESAAEVVGIMVGEMSRLSAAAVPEAELTPRKAALIGGFARSLETTTGIVDRIATLALHGLPLSDINRYISGVEAVTAEDVRKFSAATLGSDMNVVIVGDASRFIDPLRKEFEEVEVISLAELDLDSPTLRIRKKKE